MGRGPRPGWQGRATGADAKAGSPPRGCHAGRTFSCRRHVRPRSLDRHRRSGHNRPARQGSGVSVLVRPAPHHLRKGGRVRFIAAVLKTVVGGTPPGVRIPPLPPNIAYYPLWRDAAADRHIAANGHRGPRILRYSPIYLESSDGSFRPDPSVSLHTR